MVRDEIHILVSLFLEEHKETSFFFQLDDQQTKEKISSKSNEFTVVICGTVG